MTGAIMFYSSETSLAFSTTNQFTTRNKTSQGDSDKKSALRRQKEKKMSLEKNAFFVFTYLKQTV